VYNYWSQVVWPRSGLRGLSFYRGFHSRGFPGRHIDSMDDSSKGHWSHDVLMNALRSIPVGPMPLGWNPLWWITLEKNLPGINPPSDQCPVGSMLCGINTPGIEPQRIKIMEAPRMSPPPPFQALSRLLVNTCGWLKWILQDYELY